MSDIANRILDRMQEQNLSYAELSQKTGIPKSALQRYATGNTSKIPMDRIERIASALDVSAAYLMGWTDEWFDALTKKITEDIISGRTDAQEKIFQLFSNKHQINTIRLLGDNAAVLYYKAMNRESSLAIHNLLASIEDLSQDDLENICSICNAYLCADPQIRAIVDTALEPYREKDF